MAGLAIACWFENKRNEKLQKEIERLLQIQENSLCYYAELEANNKELCELKKKIAKQEQIAKKLSEEVMAEKANVPYSEERRTYQKQHVGNRFVNYILEKKKAEAEKKGIIFEVNGDLLSQLSCSEIDVVTLFDNLLENAVESCERVWQHRESVVKQVPYIKITFYEWSLNEIQNESIWFANKLEKDTMKEATFYVEIGLENSKMEIEKPLENHFKSVKKRQDLHGNGTQIVTEIVNKYSGVVEYHDEGNVFYCKIILPVKEKKNVI